MANRGYASGSATFCFRLFAASSLDAGIDNAGEIVVLFENRVKLVLPDAFQEPEV
jgi:hypothetical protein